jgi:hypothetical protein
MMNIFKGLVKAAVSTVTLPVAIAADVVTLAGSLTDRREAYTPEQFKRIMKGIDDATK